MSWTSRSWTDQRNAALALACGEVGQVIADQSAGRCQALAGRAATAPGSASGRPPRVPDPRATPARERALLSAPPHGTRETQGQIASARETRTGRSGGRGW